jgi:PKD repeat protein
MCFWGSPEACAVACLLPCLAYMRPSQPAPVGYSLKKSVEGICRDDDHPHRLTRGLSMRQTGSVQIIFHRRFAFGIRKALRSLGIAILVLYGAPLPVAALAAQVTFEWDYGDPSAAAGFMLYCGSTSGSYDTRLDVGNSTSVTVSGLVASRPYYCSVTAYDFDGESPFSNEVTMIPYAAPSPDFSMSTTSGMAPLSVALTNTTSTTSGQVSRWQWDFGDGSGSTLQDPTHVYSSPGRYTIVLTAIGPGGSVSKVATTSITVGGANPIMSAVRAAVAAVVEKPPATTFTMSSASGTAPFSVNFTNVTTGVSGLMWDFGDGVVSNEQSPTHTYYLPGTYTVVLTAAGPGGTVSKTASAQVTVSAAPGLPVGTGCSTGIPTMVLFGDQTRGTDDVSAAGSAKAFSMTASGCGNVGSLSVYVENTSTATSLIVGLYSDANGHPGALLAQGSTSSPNPSAWNTISIPPRAVNTGGVYWIAILGTQTGSVHFDTKVGSCSVETSAQSNLTALPSTWTTGSVTGAFCQVSAYGSSTP